MDSPIWGMMMSVGMISFHADHGFNSGSIATEYYSVWKRLLRGGCAAHQCAAHQADSAVRLMMVAIVHSFFFLDIRLDPEAGFPIFLHRRWKLIEVGEQHGDLPHVLLAESFVPGGHAGVAHTGTDGVEDVPLRIVGRVGDEIRRRRIKRHRQL